MDARCMPPFAAPEWGRQLPRIQLLVAPAESEQANLHRKGQNNCLVPSKSSLRNQRDMAAHYKELHAKAAKGKRYRRATVAK